jgi:predicted HTH transcriptional regulator
VLSAWKEPVFEITYQPERVTVYLEVGQVIYVPGLVDLRNQKVTVDKLVEVKADMTNEEKVLDYIHTNGSISMSETMELCGYKAKSAARKVISKLVDADKITKVGSGPITKYIIKQ